MGGPQPFIPMLPIPPYMCVQDGLQHEHLGTEPPLYYTQRNKQPYKQQERQLQYRTTHTAMRAQGLSKGQKLVLTLALPLLVLYYIAAFTAAWLITFTILPSYILAQVCTACLVSLRLP